MVDVTFLRVLSIPSRKIQHIMNRVTYNDVLCIESDVSLHYIESSPDIH